MPLLRLPAWGPSFGSALWGEHVSARKAWRRDGEDGGQLSPGLGQDLGFLTFLASIVTDSGPMGHSTL